MKFKSIKSKFAVLMIIIVIMVIIICSILVNRILKDIVKERIENEAQIILDNIVISTRSILKYGENKDDIMELIKQTASYELIDRIVFCNSEQKVLVSNNRLDVGTFIDNMCVSNIAFTEATTASHFDANEHQYEIAMSISEDENLGIMYMMLDSQNVRNMINNSTISIMIAIVTIVLLVVLVISIVMNKQIIHPLKVIRESTEKVIRNDFNNPIELNRTDEFNDLEKAFNNMINYVKHSMVSLEKEKSFAEQSSKEKMNFLARMSHEIRTPLNSIIGFSSLLLEKKTSSEDKKELEIIINASNHLINVVDEILKISRIEKNQLALENKPYSISKVIQQIRHMFEMQAVNKELNFTTSVDDNVPSVLVGDSFRIKEIIINLVGNAMKFTSSGAITVHASYEMPFLSIAVSDTGVGIPKEKQKLIFEPFEQSDQSVSRLYGGSGLGLAISKKIAELMGGNIILNSDGVNGSTFIVIVKSELPIGDGNSNMVESWLNEDPEIESIILEYLPKLPMKVNELKRYVKESNYIELQKSLHALKGVTSNLNIFEIANCIKEFEQYIIVRNDIDDNYTVYLGALDKIVSKIPTHYLEQNASNESSVKKSENLKILLAEDVPENRYLIKLLLEKHPVQIDEACNGQEAIDKLKVSTYDAMLLDIQMPVKSGIDVLKWLLENKDSKPEHIIALSANARREDMEKYLSLGCTDYLSKPVDKKLLRNMIENL